MGSGGRSTAFMGGVHRADAGRPRPVRDGPPARSIGPAGGAGPTAPLAPAIPPSPSGPCSPDFAPVRRLPPVRRVQNRLGEPYEHTDAAGDEPRKLDRAGDPAPKGVHRRGASIGTGADADRPNRVPAPSTAPAAWVCGRATSDRHRSRRLPPRRPGGDTARPGSRRPGRGAHGRRTGERRADRPCPPGRDARRPAAPPVSPGGACGARRAVRAPACGPSRNARSAERGGVLAPGDPPAAASAPGHPVRSPALGASPGSRPYHTRDRQPRPAAARPTHHGPRRP